jgi:hypothetical protein
MYGNGKHGPLKINESFVQVHKKEHKNNNCILYRKLRHFQKDCMKYKTWFERNLRWCFYMLGIKFS